MHFDSKAVIFYNETFFLQLRDKKTNIYYPNKWAFFGGRIKKNESPLNGIIRELDEELSFFPFNLKYIHNCYNLETDTKIYFFLIKLNYLKYFIVSEGQEGKWIKKKELDKLDLAPDIVFFNKFINRSSLDVFK